MQYAPYVIEQNGTKEEQYDIFARLLKDRVVFINGEINENTAVSVTSQLLYLDYQSNEDISMYINSPGGVITEGLMILDIMNVISSDIKTIVMGQASSMGSFLAAHGTKGKRASLPNARFMYHQPSGGAYGQASDIEIQAKEIDYLKKKLNKMLSDVSNLSIDEMKLLTDRDSFLTPEECLEKGFIDKIIQ